MLSVYLFLFIFGLGIGSFLNVVSLRYKPEQRLFDLKIIGGRSRCPQCRKQLQWFELIPIISFLFQRGKCRSCGNKLSWQYPIVEFLSGLIFVLVPLNLGISDVLKTRDLIFGTSEVQLASILWILVFLSFLLLSIIDFRHYIIPDGINIFLAILGIVLIIIAAYQPLDGKSFLGHYSLLFGSFGNVWVNHIVAAVLAAGFFGLIIIITRGRAMGGGDLKLAGALGLIFGWPDILLVLALSFIVGALVSLVLIWQKKKTIKDYVPFGPFLVIGSAMVFFFGFEIVRMYLSIFESIF